MEGAAHKLVTSLGAPDLPTSRPYPADSSFLVRSPAPYKDWRTLVETHGTVAALVTLPLMAAPGSVALGAATYALSSEPTAADVTALQWWTAKLAGAITHHTKHLWEVSGWQPLCSVQCAGWRERSCG